MAGAPESALRRARLDPTPRQVRALLGSATPAALRVAAAPEAGDPELAAAQQARLFALGTRTMALPLGRGALTLGAPPPGRAARPGPGE